jgi:hypothetical protein
MIEYTCKDPMSADQAIMRLDQSSIPYRRLSSTMIGFRKKPCRRAKEILTRYGLIRHIPDPMPMTEDQVEALANKFQPQEH